MKTAQNFRSVRSGYATLPLFVGRIFLEVQAMQNVPIKLALL